VKFTSRILEGMVVCRGLVEPRMRIGWWERCGVVCARLRSVQCALPEIGSMNNPAGVIAASEVVPRVAFSFEFLDAAVLVHHFPTPESGKSATGRVVHSVG
jgi:hypothetical protein